MDAVVNPPRRSRRRAGRAAAAMCLAAVLLLESSAALFAHDGGLVPNAVIRGAAGALIGSRGELGLSASDSSDVAAVVSAYHVALATGDSTAALALLAADAIIVESGGIETREEYRSHHLPGDIGFARAIKAERGPIRVVVQGDVAWATSTSTSQGEYRGRQINSSGAELMVLARTPTGWKIRAIHWSSRARRQ